MAFFRISYRARSDTIVHAYIRSKRRVEPKRLLLVCPNLPKQDAAKFWTVLTRELLYRSSLNVFSDQYTDFIYLFWVLGKNGPLLDRAV